MATLTHATFDRLCPTPIDEARLQRYVAGLTEGEKRAFWAGVLILDGKTTIAGIVERWALLEGRKPPPLSALEAEASTIAPARCLWCGEILDEICGSCGQVVPAEPTIDSRGRPNYGRPRLYCGPEHKNKAAAVAKRERREAERALRSRAG